MNYSNMTFEEFQRTLHCSHTSGDDVESWLHETLTDKNKLEQENKELREALERICTWSNSDPLWAGDPSGMQTHIAREALEAQL